MPCAYAFQLIFDKSQLRHGNAHKHCPQSFGCTAITGKRISLKMVRGGVAGLVAGGGAGRQRHSNGKRCRSLAASCSASITIWGGRFGNLRFERI